MSDSLVTKLTVRAYKDIALSKKIDSPNEFELQVNPQEISLNFGIDFKDSESKNKSGSGAASIDAAAGGNFVPRVFNKYNVPKLQIDTLIDATGVLPPPKGVELVEDGQPSVRPFITLIKKNNVCLAE